jgi:glyoxylase I family protein
MTHIVALNHVSLLVNDTARSLDFYQGLLGLELDESRPDMACQGAWLIVGSAQLHLLELPDAGRQQALPEHGGQDRHFAMSVTDLDAIEALLAAAGIRYTRSRSGRRALFCRDPDGNAVELVAVPAS